MIRINLLPHREQKRKARMVRFAVMAAVFFGMGLSAIGAGYVIQSAQIAVQAERNAFLEQENGQLDKQIAEIENLKKERQALLDRKKVIERLQSNRAESVQVLDQLVRQTPEGIYLKEVNQKDDKIALVGYAQSSARVSTLMRSLNDSPIFELEQPIKVEIKAAQVGGQRLSEFSLAVKITREQLDQDGKGKKDGKAKESKP